MFLQFDHVTHETILEIDKLYCTMEKIIETWISENRKKIKRLQIGTKTIYKPTDGKENLSYFEDQIKRFHVLNQGFDLKLRSIREIIIYETFIFLFNLIGVIRSVIIIISNEDLPYNDQIITYLGDGLAGHKSRKVVIIILLLAQSFLMGIKTTAVWFELNYEIKLLRKLAVIKNFGFDQVSLKLRFNDCQKFQRFSIIIMKSVNIITAISWFVICFAYFLLIQSTWNFTSGLMTKLLVIIWLFYFLIAVYWCAIIIFIFVCMLLIFFAYIKYLQDSTNSRTYRSASMTECSVNSLHDLVTDHNDTYNMLDLCQMFSRPILFFIFVPVTLIADVLFFFGFIHGVEEGFVNMASTIIASIIITIFAIATYLVGSINSKAIKASKSIHKLIINTPFDIQVKLKALFLLERIMETPVGMQTLDSVVLKERVIIYLLEHASNIMLFTCNFGTVR
ncbi:uncharacterized protein LOC128396959 isoform X2 [Panonychus citri]|uniref:uncharacterized protein LOC128396959 isoform X2 n=1 Tax=Panonychus citri TaxID=50023 RepID=UPI0023073629|nr:uncharacterized protein LOC128396959 isoform X2 [Panonychus citri]